MNVLGMTLLIAQVQLASVSGTVTKPGGSEPLPGVPVQLTPATPGTLGTDDQRLRSAVSEDDGRFTIEGVEPGDYRLSADSARYGRASYGQRRTDGPGAILPIGPGQQITGLRLSMMATGTIAGRVTGRNGQPAVNAPVQALTYRYRDGRRALMTAQATTTDDRGEYRLFWLPPGRYIVAVSPNPAAAIYGGINLSLLPGRRVLRPGVPTGPNDVEAVELLVAENLLGGSGVTRILEDGTRQEEAWIPIYYPSAVEPRLATTLEVTAGATLSGVNLAMEPTQVRRIRGTVTGFSPGSVPTVTLQPQDAPVSMRTAAVGRGASSIDGAFGFDGVLPGIYYLTARDMRTGLASAPVAVSVGNRDVEGLTIGMSPGVRVEGRVTLEGTRPDAAAGASLSGLVIWIQPDLPGFPAQVGNQVIPDDGSFVLTLPPGDYLLRLNTTTNRPEGAPPLYVKSMRFAGTDAMDGVRVTSSPESRVEMVLTTETGAVQGSVRDLRGTPVAGATVVLVPDAGRKRADRYKPATTGVDGTFRLSGIVPGSYKLFAWNDVETGAWQDPEFLRTFEPRGRPVVVGGNNQAAVQLELLDAP